MSQASLHLRQTSTDLPVDLGSMLEVSHHQRGMGSLLILASWELKQHLN